MMGDTAAMLRDAMNAKLDTSRFKVALPNIKQITSEILGELGGPYGTAQGHIGALMGTLLPQWAADAPKASKAGKGKSERTKQRNERNRTRREVKR